jgi:hypothetical protein
LGDGRYALPVGGVWQRGHVPRHQQLAICRALLFVLRLKLLNLALVRQSLTFVLGPRTLLTDLPTLDKLDFATPRFSGRLKPSF